MRVRDALITRLNVMCRGCCRLDVGSRKATFTTLLSLGLTWRWRTTAVWCPACRRRQGRRAALLSALFGWWGLPGLLTTPAAIRRNLAGGDLDPEDNARTLATIGSSLVMDGQRQDGRRALEQSLSYKELPEVRAALAALDRGDDPTVRPDGWSARPPGSCISTDALKHM